MLRRLVEAGQDGRLLAVNTSNLDFGEMRAWDLVAEAKRALETGESDRVHRILLASSAIPGAFPPRLIDGSLYIDGALTGNILYGGRSRATPRRSGGTFIPRYRCRRPDIGSSSTINSVRRPRWSSQIGGPCCRAAWIHRVAARQSTRCAISFALAAVSRLEYGADFEVRYISVPDDWTPPKPDVFDKEVMNALVDMGERMGADPASWRTDPP
jgi:hypothetical protein